MLLPVRTLLVGLAGVAFLVPAIGAAAVREDPPVTTPAETSPGPADPVPLEPTVTLGVPPEPPDSITIQVPPLPEPAPAARAPKPKLTRPRAHAHRITPRQAERRVAEPASRSEAHVAPVVKKKATPRKPLKELRQPQRKIVPAVSAPRRPIRDRMPTHGLLAAQYSTPAVAAPPVARSTVLYLALALATVLGMLLALVAAAPVLAGRWPQVFVPVINATERIVLTGVCLAGAALTLAITWALTGPGA